MAHINSLELSRYLPYFSSLPPPPTTTRGVLSDHSNLTLQPQKKMATFLDSIDPKRTALLLIEFQNEFTTEQGKLHAAVKPVMDSTNMLDNSVALVEKARSKGIKIFHAPITFSDDYRELSATSYGILGNVKGGQCFLASQWGGEFHPRMTPGASDVVIAGKRGLCAFASTNLDFCLRQNGIETLVIGGFLTNCCVESTMRTAYEKG